MPLESDYHVPVPKEEEEEFVDENYTSAVAAANPYLSHDTPQTGPGSFSGYRVPHLLPPEPEYDNNDCGNDDDNDNFDDTKIVGMNMHAESSTQSTHLMPEEREG